MTRVGVLGATGRMGKWVCSLLEGEYSARAQLVARASRGSSPSDLLKTDAVIDFSLPDAMESLALAALEAPGKLPVFVVGSTGWKIDKVRLLEKLAQRTPVLMSSNFSTGVLALQKILAANAPLLVKLGYTPVMVETHHRHKKDAPSGTAIMLNRTIESSTGGAPVQTHAVRSGEVIGDHEITFYGAADKITLGHFAQDRSIFSRGAIDVALWMHARRDSLAGGNVLSMLDYAP